MENKVKCYAKNCYYNGKNCTCKADSIEIQSPYAKTSDDTICETFLEKEDGN